MDPALIPIINLQDLLGPVRRLPGLSNAEVVDWTIHVVKPSGPGMPSSVYRVTGHAQLHGSLVPWSLILKILHDPAAITPSPMLRLYNGDAASSVSSLMYWKREALIYREQVLKNTPGGLRAPACYGVHEAPDGDLWLWLESLHDQPEGRWPVARYGAAARMLGRFNGAYLNGYPRPAAPWLSTEWLWKSAAWAAPALAVASSVAKHRMIKHWLDPDNLALLLRIWAAREVLLAELDRLPQTFCHNDAHRFNLFVCSTQEGGEELVAIDWAGAGSGPIGSDLGLMVGVAALWNGVDSSQRDELDAVAFDSYMSGLQEAGWNGPADLARLGHCATMALKVVIGYLPGVLASWLDESWYARYEQHTGQPIEVYAAHYGDALRWLLRRGEEALCQVSPI